MAAATLRVPPPAVLVLGADAGACSQRGRTAARGSRAGDAPPRRGFRAALPFRWCSSSASRDTSSSAAFRLLVGAGAGCWRLAGGAGSASPSVAATRLAALLSRPSGAGTPPAAAATAAPSASSPADSGTLRFPRAAAVEASSTAAGQAGSRSLKTVINITCPPALKPQIRHPISILLSMLCILQCRKLQRHLPGELPRQRLRRRVVKA